MGCWGMTSANLQELPTWAEVLIWRCSRCRCGSRYSRKVVEMWRKAAKVKIKGKEEKEIKEIKEVKERSQKRMMWSKSLGFVMRVASRIVEVMQYVAELETLAAMHQRTNLIGFALVAAS